MLSTIPGVTPRIEYFGLLAIAFIAPQICKRAWSSLANWPPILDINCLMVLAGAGAVAIGDVTEGATVVVLFGLSDWLESLATTSVREAIRAIIDLKPEVAVLAESRKTIQVEDVEKGMQLEVRAGEKVPVDGVVVKGSGFIDNSMLTGESVPLAVGAKKGVGGDGKTKDKPRTLP
eukprot:jgi/Bigna1/143649/aug1.80_g18357